MSTGIVAVTTGLLRDCVFVKAVCCMSCICSMYQGACGSDCKESVTRMIPQADGLSSRSVGFESTHPGTLVGSHSCALCVVLMQKARGRETCHLPSLRELFCRTVESRR